MKSLKRFIVLTSSLFLLLVPKKFAVACGFYVFPGEYRFWLLQPDLTNQQDLTPFFFASTYLYKGNMFAAVETYPDVNISEWYHEIKGKAFKKDIDSILNNTEPRYFFANEKAIASRNSFLREHSKPENQDLYQYLRLSKKVEQAANISDPWDEKNVHYGAINTVISEADSLYHRASSPFVKLRTAYQLTRLYGFNGQMEKLNRVYDARIAPVKTSSWIKTAALYQKAIKTPGFEGDYLLSKVFDNGGYKRIHCLMKIRTKDLDSILPYAKNRHEKVVLSAMKVFNNPGRSLSTIKEIYRAEPAYKELSFLLLREINKIEDWLVTVKVTEFGNPAVYNGGWWESREYRDAAASNYKRDKDYGKEFYDFLLQLIREKRQADISLLRLYAAHLALLRDDPVSSEQILSQITKERELPLNIRTQLRINRFLLRLEKGLDQKTENEFMGIVKSSSRELGVYDPTLMKDQLILYTARKLVKKGMKAKGLMLMSQTNRALGELPISIYKTVYQELEEIATPTVYDEVLMTLEKKKKTAFEQFVSNPVFGSPWNYYDDETEKWDKNKILDYKASWYIRNHDLKSALNVLQQIPDSYFTKKPHSLYIGGNPFYLNVYHAHSVTKADKRDLNKKKVIEQMINLEKLAQKDRTKTAECYYQLANAWYNMSWYGKNWLIVKQWWSQGEMYDNSGFKQSAFNDDYYGCRIAKEYYLKALQITKDKDLATLSCFMAGICENNFRRYMWSTGTAKKDWYDYENIANPYIVRLKQKTVDNSIYTKLVKECPLYIDFIGKYNKQL